MKEWTDRIKEVLGYDIDVRLRHEEKDIDIKPELQEEDEDE